MKKVLTLLVAGLMFLMFIGCDTGSVGSDPINPTEPVVTLAVGDLTLTLDDPEFDVENEVDSPLAFITGASSNGATFSEELTLENLTGNTLTIKNLLVGDWNIRVQVWEVDMVTAVAYETAVVVDGVDTALSPELNTFDDVNNILATVYESYNIAEDPGKRENLTMSLWVLMNCYENFATEYLEYLSGNASLFGELQDIFLYFLQISDTEILQSRLETLLGEYDEVLEATYLFILNTTFGLNMTAAEYVNLFVDMLSTVNTEIVGDYEALFYDLVDVTLVSPDGFIANGYLPDGDTFAFSVYSDYDSLTGISYVWYLNGNLVGTGSSYNMALADCVTDLNYLSVQFVLSADDGSVILGSDSVAFYKEISSGGDTIGDLADEFPDTDLYAIILASCNRYYQGASTPVEDIKKLDEIMNYPNLNLTGMQNLVNLESLVIVFSNITTESQVAPLLGLTQLKSFVLLENPPVDQAFRDYLEKAFPGCSFTFD